MPHLMSSTSKVWRMMKAKTCGLSNRLEQQMTVMTEEDSGPSTSTLPPPNIVPSWGAGSPAWTGARPKRSAAVQPPAKARREGDKLEKVRTFKARPLPKRILEGVVGLPEKKVWDLTVPESPAFAPKRIRLEKVEEGKGEEAVFKARPNTVTHKEPFQPKKEARTPLVVQPFELSTERRALERQEFAQRLKEKEALRIKMEEAQRQEWEEKEKEEITRMRQKRVHTAQPIRRYKPVTVKKSEVPLTVPHPPNF
ncbi:targeting protein for Xklp2-like [Pungitius pungitius]|uniref:targeting protein for Xklp2-like n=1 Tax=Pungitius pungitius TaxID=134920 RepID=UPI0018883A23|nr:targeting protein for Xklp2-like [Pungitius pungitius]